MYQESLAFCENFVLLVESGRHEELAYFREHGLSWTQLPLTLNFVSIQPIVLITSLGAQVSENGWCWTVLRL